MRSFRKLGEEIEAARRLLRLLKPPRGAVWGLVLLGILSSLAEGLGIGLFIPFLQSLDGDRFAVSSENWLVNALVGLFQSVPPERRLFVIGSWIIAIVFVKVVLTYGHHAYSKWVDAQVGHRLRSDVFAQLLGVGYGYIDTHDQGDLLNTLSTETWRVTGALSTLLWALVLTFTALVYVTLLVLISWPLTLFVATALWAISAGVRMLKGRITALGREVTRVNAALATRMLEGMEGMKVIRTFGREEYEHGRFDEASKRVSSVLFRLGLVSGSVGPLYELLTATLLVFTLFIGLRDSANLPALLVFIFVLYRLQPRVRSLDETRLGLAALTPALDDVEALLRRDDKPFTSSGHVPFAGMRSGIRFGGVGFHYEGVRDPVLEGVSTYIPAGKTTALVGPSGAGKSTLIKLLLRFYEPTEGEILVDGTRLEEFDLASWRAGIGLVSQDVYVFNASIRDNIAYGKPGATEAEVEGAARQADAHRFISEMSEGYETRIGDRGVRLSGGQRQRLALARAIVRDPDILVLDEATNSLDALSEHFIQEALEALRRDRTVIVIAHRLATVEQADHIIVLDEGRIREEGTRDELLANPDLFAQLYALQNRGEAPEHAR